MMIVVNNRYTVIFLDQPVDIQKLSSTFFMVRSPVYGTLGNKPAFQYIHVVC